MNVPGLPDLNLGELPREATAARGDRLPSRTSKIVDSLVVTVSIADAHPLF